MTLDLFQPQMADRLSTASGIQNLAPGAWDGFWRGTGQTAMQYLAKAGSAIDLAGAVGPIVQDMMTGGVEAQTKYFKEHDDVWRSAVDYWAPNPDEVGMAATVAGSLLGALPLIFASPGLAVATTQLGTGEELIRKGVSDERAQLAGAIAGTGLGIGIWMPVLGQTAAQRIIVGGALGNVAQGVATRAGVNVAIGKHPAAKEFEPFDGTMLTLDVLLGMAFGGWAHLSPGQRAQGAEAWGKIRKWAMGMDDEQRAALATLRVAQHLNKDSMPGVPDGPADLEAHARRIRTALEQVSRGEPVNVEHLPSGTYAPDPARAAEAQAQAVRLVDSAPRVRAEERILDLDRSGDERSVDHPPPPGTPFLMYRAAAGEGAANYGNADAVARFLALSEDATGPGRANVISVFRAVTPEPFGDYEAPGAGIGRVTRGSEASYSVGESAAGAVEKIGELPLREVIAALEARGHKSFGDAGPLVAADVIRELSGRHGLGAKQRQTYIGWAKSLPAADRERLARLPELAARYESAFSAEPEFTDLIHKVAAEVGGRVQFPPIKGVARAAEKVVVDYNGSAAKLKDLLRATIVVDDISRLDTVMDSLRRNSRVTSWRNLFSHEAQTIDGYRDIKFNVMLTEGHVAEVQANIPEMVAAKRALHGDYEQRDAILRAADEAGRPLTPEEAARVAQINQKMRETYDTVWSGVLARAAANSSAESGAPLRYTESSGKERPAGTSQAVAAEPSGASDTGTPSTSQNVVPIVRAESGIRRVPPHIDLRNVPPADQPLAIGEAVAAKLRDLKVPEAEAVANAEIWRAFFDTASKRYGEPAADILNRYGVDFQKADTLAEINDVYQMGRQDWVPLRPYEGPQAPNPLAPFVARDGIAGAQGRLTRALERAPEVGGPDNARIVLKAADGRTFAVGKITPTDWWERVSGNLSREEITAARRWYGDLHGLMARFFGEENAARYSLAWLLSQQRASPTKGLQDVLRAADKVAGLHLDKKAGLNEAALVSALRGEIPTEGYGAKLLDFIDSELGRTTRTIMGDDARGGQPAVIDVWGNRDVGKLDQTTLDWLKANFENVPDDLKVDGARVGETDYEYGARFYNDLVNYLNKSGADGGNWRPLEAQAVGWVAMQKLMGRSPEFPADMFANNTLRVSIGLAPGEGTPLAGRGEISSSAAKRVIDAASQLTGARVVRSSAGSGAYLGQRETSFQVDVLGSPETIRDFADSVGYALRQTEVLVSRPLKSGKTQGVTIAEAAGSTRLADPTTADAFMAAVRERLPEGSTIADGYQMVLLEDGRAALRMFKGTWDDAAGRVNWSGKWKPAELEALKNAVAEVAAEQGHHLGWGVGQFDVHSSFNNWGSQPHGEGYRQGFAERGRLAVADQLDRVHDLQVLPDEVGPAKSAGGLNGTGQETLWQRGADAQARDTGAEEAGRDQGGAAPPPEADAQGGRGAAPAVRVLAGAQPAAFRRALEASKLASKYGAAVRLKDEADYAGMKLHMAEDGSAGFALDGDNIVSVFSNGTHKGIAEHLIAQAVEAGGRRLDAYDTVLPAMYGRLGFRAVAKTRWTDASAPPGWDREVFAAFNDGRPDGVYMVYDPQNAGRSGVDVAPYVANRAEAIRRQDEAVRRGGRPSPAELLAAEERQMVEDDTDWDAFSLSLGTRAQQLAQKAPPRPYDGPTSSARADSTAPRGMIRFGDDRTIIGLFEHADASTFLHESGHLFLRVMRDMAMANKGNAEVRRDWATISAWLDLDQASTLGRQQHEKFARGFEKYVATGQAPVPELRSVFQQFREWLLSIYKSIARLDVKVTPAIQDVFARMLGDQRADPTLSAYHGTDKAFYEFDPSLQGAKSSKTSWASVGRPLEKPVGFYFSNRPDFASSFATGEGGNVRPSRLTVKNPKVVPEEVISSVTPQMRERVLYEGYDSMMTRGGEQIVVFNREQIQSEFEAPAKGAEGAPGAGEASAARPPPRGAEEQTVPARPEAEQLPERAAAERVVAENPNLAIRTGEDADGTPQFRTAQQFMEAVALERADAADDAMLFQPAADLIMRGADAVTIKREMARAAGRELSDAEIAAVFSRIHKAALDIKAGRAEVGEVGLGAKLEKRLGVGEEGGTIVQEAAARAARELEHEAMVRERQAYLQLLAIGGMRGEVGKLMDTGLSPIEAVDRTIFRDYSGKLNVESLEQMVMGYRTTFQRKLMDTWHALGDDFLGFFQDRTKLLDLVKELHGEDSGNPLAKKGAKAFHDVAEEMRLTFNSRGGDIGKLEDWSMPHDIHSQELVSRYGKKEWVDRVLPLVRRTRDQGKYYLDEAGVPWDDARLRGMLEYAWDNIATNGWAHRDPGVNFGPGKRANRHAEHRQIHFPDAQSVIDYWGEFGGRSALEILAGHVDVMSRDIGFIEKFGPNPRLTFRTLLDEAMRKQTMMDPVKTGKAEEQRIALERNFDYVAGNGLPTANVFLRKTADSLSHLNVAAKLGGAAVASFFGDKPLYEAVSHMNDIPAVQRWVTETALLNPLNRADRRLLQTQGLMLEAIRSGLQRFADGLGKDQLSGKIANAVMRLTGMTAINEIRKGAFGLGLMGAIGNEVASGRRFADLPDSDVRVLRTFGVDEVDWRVWKLARLDTISNVRNVLTPEAISEIPDAAIKAAGLVGAMDGPTAAADLRRSAIVKLLGAVNTESEFAIATPGWKERAQFYSGIQRGTVKGEMFRAILQFKSFPWTYMKRGMDLVANQDTPLSKAAMTAYLVAATTLAGAMIIQTRETLLGKDPRKMVDDNWYKFWAQAFLQGGSLGIYGDFLYGANQTRYGSGPIEAVAGPTLGPMLELALTQPLAAARAKYFEGGRDTHLAAQSFQDLKGFIPGGNIWYTKAVLDHLIFHQVMEMLSPGYLSSIRSRTQREYNQDWWWGPGEFVPQRTPDFSGSVTRR